MFLLYDGRAEMQPYEECSVYDTANTLKQAAQRAKRFPDAVVVRYRLEKDDKLTQPVRVYQWELDEVLKPQK